MQGKFIVFSFVLFLFLFILGSSAFIILMGRIQLDTAGPDLMKTVELERLKLEAFMNSEIAIVLKMADSPLIKRYFTDPYDPILKELAFEEFEAYRRAFISNTVFWVSDRDKIFHIDGYAIYEIDPTNPEDYWYNMTLFETEVYNFNINYNPELNLTNLWINAPVFDNDNRAIGMVGTGINLSNFILTIYHDRSETSNLYLFNSAGEITGAMNINLVKNKVNIKQVLGQTGEKIFAGTKQLELDGMKYFETKDRRGVAFLAAIPALDWYVTAVKHFSIIDSLRTGMTVLFAIMIGVILAIFVVFNKFIAGLLKPFNRMIKKMTQITSGWGLNSESLAHKKDEVNTLSEFLDMTVSMMNDKLNAERIAHESELAKARAEAAKEAIVSGIEYASKIQKNLLPSEKVFKEAFSDYFCIWKPRDIVGGDMYWIKNFSEGTTLCVFDCTGHGTPGALLTMLVASTLEAIVNDSNYKDTAQIIWELEKQLVNVLNVDTSQTAKKMCLNINDGCDLAMLYITKEGSVNISTGNTHVYVCDGNKNTRIKGQKIHIGSGTLKSKDDINVITIPANHNNKFYIASDGLYEQIGGEDKIPFGYDKLEEIIFKYHDERQMFIAEKIWLAFEEYRGDNSRRDDFELITFKCKVEAKN